MISLAAAMQLDGSVGYRALTKKGIRDPVVVISRCGAVAPRIGDQQARSRDAGIVGPDQWQPIIDE